MRSEGNSDDRPSRVGEVLGGKYRVVRLLGEGGMGAVYEAQHVVVGRRFAVKFLHAELASQDDILERFRREARTAGSLESENIASVVDFGSSDDGIPYILMEYLVGEDFARLLAREGPLPTARAVGIIIQACRGLDAAHAAGIVHRDLKPENLFICKRGDGSDLVKILDFGIAKLAAGTLDGQSSSVTRTGSTMGTPFYMPPEQARGAKELDHRADIYALGVILFEALTGEKPHPGDSYNAILYHILTQPPTPIASLRPGLPSDLVDLLMRTLAFEPADRPPSAMAVARALVHHAGRQVTPLQSQFELRVPGAPDRAKAGSETRPAAEPVDPATAPAPQVRTPTGAEGDRAASTVASSVASTARRKLVAVAASIAILGTAAGAFLLWQRATPPGQPSPIPMASTGRAPDSPPLPARSPTVPTSPQQPPTLAPTLPQPSETASAGPPARERGRTLGRPRGRPRGQSSPPASRRAGAAPESASPDKASVDQPVPLDGKVRWGVARPPTFDTSDPYE